MFVKVDEKEIREVESGRAGCLGARNEGEREF